LRRQPSLRSQLNQIRLWVRQGRTDAWIAHKLDVSIEQLERFKRDHDLLGDEAAPGRPADPLSVPPPDLSLYDEEPDEEDEAEDEEPVGALLDEPEDDDEEPPARERSRSRSRGRGRGRGRERGRDSDDRPGRKPAPSRRAESDVETEIDSDSDDDVDRDEDDGKAVPSRRRRRGRRGGRGRRRSPSFEATFDHGEDGYGLWLDPAVVDNPIYAQHWAGHRAIEVTFDQDSITIRRAATDSGDAGPAAEEDEDQ
jgi:hypothetical protein